MKISLFFSDLLCLLEAGPTEKVLPQALHLYLGSPEAVVPNFWYRFFARNDTPKFSHSGF
nr:hypothetical protein [Desulfovibrio sp. Fe33]